MPSLTTILASSLSTLALIPVLAIAGGTSNDTRCLPAAATSTTGQVISGPVTAAGTTWDTEQATNAALIIVLGQTRGIPARGWVIAIATALQESRLRNLPGGDADSIGLFQQRPSTGWGTPTQLTDPAYQTTTFYDALLTVPSWQDLPLTQAAQAVQRSAHPNAYAQWETPATALIDQITTGSDNSANPTSDEWAACPDGTEVLTRAETWLTAWNGGPVPYSMSTDPASLFGGYRRDCSGYASMTLGLPGPGLNTAGLAARSTPIPKTALHPGDLLINPAPGGAGHVVIFDTWTDTAMTHYLAYEQSGDGGTHHRVIPYPYYGTYPMSAYRPR